MAEIKRRPGESSLEYEKRKTRLKSGVPQKTPEQLRQEALYNAETKRLAAEAEKPQLAAYQGLETLGDAGKLSARTLTGAEIQKQMEESPWYKMALQKQESEQSRLMDQAARQQAGALAGARSQLAMRGGLGGGSAERLASSGAENLTNLMQQQRQASAIERGQLGMQGADLASRLGQFNLGQQSEADKINLQAQLANLAAKENRSLQQYGEQMKGYAAGKTSEGIGSGGSSGLCCFIFLEARYGNGTMDEVVRRYRDEKMTDKNRRGYYKMSEVLVPVMRKSKLAKAAVRTLMTDPMVSYGKWYYGKGKIGWVFKPVVNFWLKTFDYLGLDHEYIRENGEVV
jgi:hypothetical protein